MSQAAECANPAKADIEIDHGPLLPRRRGTDQMGESSSGQEADCQAQYLRKRHVPLHQSGDPTFKSERALKAMQSFG